MGAFDTGDNPTMAAPTVAQQVQFRTATGSASVPWRRSDCAAWWLSSDTELVSTKIDTWNDLVAGTHPLTQTTDASRATWAEDGARMNTGIGYDVGGSGISFDPRNFTMFILFPPNLNVESYSNKGLMFQTSGGQGFEFLPYRIALAGPGQSAPAFLNKSGGYSSLVIVGTSTTVRVYNNGTMFSTGTPFTAGTQTLLKMFSNNSGTNGSTAPVYGAGIFTRAMEAPEVNEICAQMGALHSGGGYNLIGEGDSQTLGTGVSTWSACWFGRVATTLGTRVSYAPIAGRSVATMNGISSSDIIRPRGGRNIYTCMWGTNDIAFATGAAAGTITNIQGLIGKIRTADPTGIILAFTILPRSSFFSGGQNTAGHAADAATVNASVSANAVSWGANAVVDVAAIPSLSDSTNTTYYTDGTHLATAGNTLVGDEVVAVLLTLGIG